MKPETKKCQNCQKNFQIESEDFAFYKKIKVPAPTFCPDCRRQRRLSWRNDYVFYNRKCDMCEKNIISIYSPDNPQIIYCNKCWWSDKWDPREYAQEFDFSKPFFEQFKDFRKKIPTIALVNDNGIGSTNSEYMQNVQYSKNCYMAMVSWKIEDCMYFSYGAGAKEAVDSMGIFGASEGIYETLYSDKCFGSRYLQNCVAVMDSSFCYDCRECNHCFQCAGLRNKKYCIKNKQYSKEEYEKILSKYRLDTWAGNEKSKKEFEEFLINRPVRYNFLFKCQDCTGNNQINGKNSKNVFHVKKAIDCKYLENGDTETDSYDLCVGGELSECYEGLTPDHSNKALFTNYVWKSMNVSYSDFCMSSNDLFGCVGLRNKSYYIFNKQYSKKEYEKLKMKIIKHMTKHNEWGEFFPMSCSPFAYNESMAQLSFPITKNKALEQNLKWQDNIQKTQGKTTVKEIADSIFDIDDSIVNEILECNSCQRNYKITKQELNFYRKWKIPVPRECFFCRLKRRFELRGPSKLYKRTCMKEGCNTEFETTYAPDRPEIVYCEACYQQEVV